MFEGSQHHDNGYFQPLQGAGALAERIDQRRSHELLGSRAVQRARARAVDGIRSHGLPAAGADRGEVREPARRRAERAAAELREPALRPGADGDAGGAVSAAIIRITGRRSARSPICTPRSSTTCAQFFRTLLPPGQRVARARRRHRSRRRAGARATPTSAICRAGPPVEPVRPADAAADGETRLLLEDRVELPRLYLAWLTPAMFAAGRRRARSRGRHARQRQDLAPVPPAGLRASGSPPTCRPPRTRARSPASFRSPRPPRPGHTLAELEAVDRRGDRSGWRPRVRPRTRSSAAACRPKRSSCSGCRRSAASAASPIS